MSNLGLFIIGIIILGTYLFFLCRMVWTQHKIQEKENPSRKESNI